MKLHLNQLAGATDWGKSVAPVLQGGIDMDHTILSPADIPLADIRDVSVDPKLPKEERIAEFLRQIKNPYCFKCGKFTVRAQFADNGVSLEDCLKQILI